MLKKDSKTQTFHRHSPMQCFGFRSFRSIRPLSEHSTNELTGFKSLLTFKPLALHIEKKHETTTTYR